MDRIEFKEIDVKDFTANKIGEAVVVFRDGRQVAYVRESKRLEQAMNLPLSNVRDIRDNFEEIVGRKPKESEEEFWKAMAEYKCNENDS